MPEITGVSSHSVEVYTLLCIFSDCGEKYVCVELLNSGVFGFCFIPPHPELSAIQ